MIALKVTQKQEAKGEEDERRGWTKGERRTSHAVALLLYLLFVFPLISFMLLILDGVLINTVVSYTQKFLKEPDLISDCLLLLHPL